MPNRQPTVAILTLGCKVNQYESEAIAERFAAEGFLVQSAERVCDIYVINTCTVTAEADRKAGQLARRVHLKNPNAPILLTGCFSQAAPDKAAAVSGVRFVCGNRDKLGVVEAARRLLLQKTPANGVEIAVPTLENAPFEPMQITRFDRTRAYVKIEDGCENHCTYCAIRGARGPVRSKPLADVVEEVKGLVAGGCREVVLTGIETSSWGRDLKTATLADLLEAVDAIPGIGRVRLGSLDPSSIREDFVKRISRLGSLAPHFHLSMQSGSSRILALMKRKYNRDQALNAIHLLRTYLPSVELTTDFIVGFPAESEEDFEQTLSLAREADFLSMHVFAYSRRAGTPAATYPDQIPTAVKKQRSARLIELSAELKKSRLQRALCDPLQTVLFETYENGIAIGHTPGFLEVRAPSPVPLHSKLRTVTLTAVEGEHLVAKLEDEIAHN